MKIEHKFCGDTYFLQLKFDLVDRINLAVLGVFCLFSLKLYPPKNIDQNTFFVSCISTPLLYDNKLKAARYWVLNQKKNNTHLLLRK